MQEETAEDFILIGEDFTNFIKTDEDRQKFNRMKELEKEFHKPASECYEAVFELDRLRRELLGLKQLTVIHLDGRKAKLN